MVTTDNGTASSKKSSAPKRPWRVRGGLVTVATVVALVAAMGLTVLGRGAADNALASYDASSWLWSAAKSELARVNGVTGRVDTRSQVPQARGHAMQVTQTDRFLILRDLATGQMSSLDLATLQINATTRTTAGLGVSVAMHEDAAFVIDAVQGVVRQLDPRSLVPVGEPVRYPPGIAGGFFDGAGRLWIAVPSEGTVSAITPAPLPSSAAPSSGGSGGGLSPKLIRTVAVAPPSNDLAISTLDDGVAVLNRTSNTLTIVRGEDQRDVPLTMRGPGALPPRTNGGQVPVTVPDDRQVLVVGDAGVQEFAVPGEGTRLRPAVAWSGRFYCADDATGTIYAFDAVGKLVDKIEVNAANGLLELEVRENYLFINAPNSSTARVVDTKHAVRVVDKYANDILGGDPPPVPPPPPPPKKPQVGKPSAPRGVTAAAGNAQVRVSWGAAASNGAAITKYVVAGDGKTREVGANQRSIEITGLTNGKTYRFSVHAVNAKGAGPSRMSNPVVPTAEVPDPPASVTAEARPDGTVLVKWPAANGQGRKITKYAVTAASAGAAAPVGESAKTQLVIPAGELEYGTQYAFTVVAVNEKGAGSKASPVSNTVVPFTLPGRPQGLTATTVAGERGAVEVRWAPAQDNGRPVTKYVVDANGSRTEVTDGTQAKLTGLDDGQTVTIKVQAVNEAGAGPAATGTARTVANPQVTITGTSADHTSVTVNLTVDDGGGQAQCTATIPGAPAASGSCSRLTVGGLKPSSSYTITVTARNAAGDATASRAQGTAAVYGRAVCNNNTSSSDPAQRVWCNDPDNGRQIRNGTSESAPLLGRAGQNQQLRAICKVTGSSIRPYVYNRGKADPTSIWIRVPWGSGTGYISFAWFNLEGYGINSTGPLPNC